MTDSTTPVPLDPMHEDSEDRRLWIGNLDPRITEFTLVKLLQSFGTLEKFDMIFHRTGPLEGQPRGYAFVTYTSKQIAETAKKNMDGTLLGSKNLCVKWAHNLPKNDLDKQKVVPDILALGGNKAKNKVSRINAIKAIEAKLRVMEEMTESSDFKITDEPTVLQGATSGEELLKNRESKSSKIKHQKSTRKPYLKTKWKT